MILVPAFSNRPTPSFNLFALHDTFNVCHIPNISEVCILINFLQKKLYRLSTRPPIVKFWIPRQPSRRGNLSVIIKQRKLSTRIGVRYWRTAHYPGCAISHSQQNLGASDGRVRCSRRGASNYAGEQACLQLQQLRQKYLSKDQRGYSERRAYLIRPVYNVWTQYPRLALISIFFIDYTYRRRSWGVFESP